MSIHEGVNGTLTEERGRPVKLVKVPTGEAAVRTLPRTAPVEKLQERKERRRRVRAFLQDERTRDMYRLAVRHGSYLAGGTRIITSRAWDGRTTARYQRMIRTAEAAGNRELAAEWEEKEYRYRQARHQRRMDLLASMRTAPKAVGAGLLTGAGVLTLMGIAIAVANGNVSDLLLPFEFVIGLINWAYIIGSVVWGAAKLFGPALGLLALWNVGRQRQAAPTWALPEKLRTDGGPITPSIVVKAFRDLRIGELKKAIIDMEDGGASMLSPIVLAGCGVEVDVTLPSSVSTDEIEKKRRKLAENLNRHEHEVFILKSPQPRTVKLWIADSGALDEPIGPSPLVTDPGVTANFATGRAPWGVDLRGDAASLSVHQRHLLVTGLSNQGKTAAIRALALWAAFDPRVRFRIADLKGFGDWAMFEGIADVLIQGPTDDHVAAATEMVEESVREMERRLVAPAGTDFEIWVTIVDEAQVAFMCPAKDEQGLPYGGVKATSRYFNAARKLHNQGRAVDDTFWQGTQDPTDQNLPKLVREGAHVRASLVVGTESQAKMALGDKAVDGGAAPHLLRQGLDKGTLVVAGDGVELAPGEASVTVRTHFISTEEAHDIADRAKALRKKVSTIHKLELVEQLDPLADIVTVIANTPRLRTQEVLQLLAERNPAGYREWTFQDLKEVLEAADAAPHKSDGQMVVDRRKVQRALAERDSKGQGGERKTGSSP